MKAFKQGFERISFFRQGSLGKQYVDVVYQSNEEDEEKAWEALWNLSWTKNGTRDEPSNGPVPNGPGYSSWFPLECIELPWQYDDIPDKPTPEVDWSTEVPDIAESVNYDGRSWRVSGWYCQNEKYPWRMRNCVREEAQVVGLSGVCGAIVRIDEVERTGKYVQWSLQLIESERDRALSRIDTYDIHPLLAKKYIPDAPNPPTDDEVIENIMKEMGF